MNREELTETEVTAYVRALNIQDVALRAVPIAILACRGKGLNRQQMWDATAPYFDMLVEMPCQNIVDFVYARLRAMNIEICRDFPVE